MVYLVYFSRHSKILSAFCNVTYTYRHTVRFGYPNITESVLRSPRSQLAVERTVQELLDQQGKYSRLISPAPGNVAAHTIYSRF